jgi:hypothetical protein
MNSTKAHLMNLPIRELLLAKSPADAMTFHARWQTAVETVPGYALQKLRLELAPFSKFLGTSTHGSNDNDRSINSVRPSHLPVSACMKVG